MLDPVKTSMKNRGQHETTVPIAIGNTEKTSVDSKNDFSLKDITQHIISCAIAVHSVLGPGLLESVYEEVFAREFSLRKLCYERQKEICLRYKGKDIGSH